MSNFDRKQYSVTLEKTERISKLWTRFCKCPLMIFCAQSNWFFNFKICKETHLSKFLFLNSIFSCTQWVHWWYVWLRMMQWCVLYLAESKGTSKAKNGSSWSHKLFIEWGVENKSAFQRSSKRDLSIQTMEKIRHETIKEAFTHFFTQWIC